MNTSTQLSRRGFVKSAAFASAALASTGILPQSARAAVVKEAGDPFKGLKVGIASYSLRNFPLEQAIEMTREAGVKYITLKDVHLAMKSTPEQRREAAAKVKAGGLTLMGGGVIYMNNDEAQIRQAFEYARDASMPTVVCSPEPAALDTVEKMAKEFSIRVAIHNHGPGDKRYPSPMDVLRLIKGRHELMGVCIDVGHTVRIGEDPVQVIKKCADRLYDFHIKDVTAATPKGGGAEVGKGVIDIVAVLRTLLKIKFPYHVALEYEDNAKNPQPGIVESFAYMRGVLAAL